MSAIERFYDSMERLGISREQLETQWKYAGGDQGRHLRYFHLAHGEAIPPPTEYECKCGQRIIRNCYITDADNTRFVVVGSCCIKRFMTPESQGRTCERCGHSHKNIKVNRCNDCRCICDKCEKFKPKDGLCWECDSKTHLCAGGCGKTIKKHFDKCLDCIGVRGCAECGAETSALYDLCPKCAGTHMCERCHKKKISVRWHFCWACK